ncbi:exocyst complex component 3 [Ischnura elegans]|uniref:exocyst complex component 3 n=1 Tax=Ischnura elegans TaxID=197161 RepID=UPI001ED88B2A|nr:exocyst complex component 3 [Ischnura elegans]XP_046407256.1 exocyst complex component 3 [Ischnura elegans]XP_046407257.1 exocyst complex component 3 [Ischnura elegans]
MDVEKQEAEAKKTGETHVTNMLQRPDQLEKVEQYMRKRSRNKASVEAMLKTAMQSQLDGVRVGLNQVQVAQQDIQGIKESLVSLDKLFSSVPKLYEKLQDVRDENMRHSQYVTAMENLKHIFTVPESVEKTKQWIQEGKLLLSFQSLTDLENSRDDLLYELHKLPNQAPADKSMLKAYFEDVEVLSQLLEKQLRLVLSRTLNTVRKEPTVIVTALRIIEREEKADTFALQRHKESGFLPPGRPKKWREMAMEVLEKEVAQRIEGTHVDERNDNKMWLVRYLELTRQLILEDLRVVKTLCVPCFPPSYEITKTFLKMYHDCLSRHLQEIIQSGLQGNEIVSLLSWIMNTYPGMELMQNPELDIDKSSIKPLLEPSIVDELQQTYLKTMENNYSEWMQKTLLTEKEDWQKGEAPQGDDQDGHFHTASPVIIYQMIDQNLQVTQTISPELTFKALVLGMEQVIKYCKMYREAIIAFKCRHFEDRSQVPYFTHYIITIANNCLQFRELARHTKERYWKAGYHDSSAAQKYEALLRSFQNLRDEVAFFLLEEAFLDLELHFQNLITQKWMTSSHPVDTICVTLEDYFQDYVHLTTRNFDHVITEAQNLVAKKYISAMLQKKVTFKSYEDRKEAGLKIIKEAEQIKGLFIRVAPNVANYDSPFDIIRNLAEVLKSEDPEILSLDLHGLVDKYPDVTPDQLTQLLGLRGDISRSDAHEKVSFIFNANKSKHREIKTIFSLL